MLIERLLGVSRRGFEAFGRRVGVEGGASGTLGMRVRGCGRAAGTRGRAGGSTRKSIWHESDGVGSVGNGGRGGVEGGWDVGKSRRSALRGLPDVPNRMGNVRQAIIHTENLIRNVPAISLRVGNRVGNPAFLDRMTRIYRMGGLGRGWRGTHTHSVHSVNSVSKHTGSPEAAVPAFSQKSQRPAPTPKSQLLWPTRS